jgi:hypothetical protein
MNEAQTTKPAWTKRKKTFFIIGALIVVAAVPAFTWMFMEMHAANQALTTFGEALVSRDYERAYNLTSSEFRAAVTKAAFVDQQEALATHLGALKKVVPGASETVGNQNGWSSTISVRLQFERAERRFAFVMKKEGDLWLVYSYTEQ